MLWDHAQNKLSDKIKLVPDEKIERVVLCTGKVYYDLFEERESRGTNSVYLMRIEQALSVPGSRSDPGTEPLSERRNCLVSGRAEKPGCLDVCRAKPRMGSGTHRCQVHASALHRPPCERVDRCGSHKQHTAELHAFLDDALTLQR